METFLFYFTLLTFFFQQAVAVPVTIQLRNADSTPFIVDVNIRDDERAIVDVCTTDGSGRCTVQLKRGLYLVEPMGTTLDEVSASAAVEIGGQWLGITVGDMPISYGFVVENSTIFFDDTPADAVARPIKPSEADIKAHFAPEAEQTPSVEAAEPVEVIDDQLGEPQVQDENSAEYGPWIGAAVLAMGSIALVVYRAKKHDQ